MDNSLMSSEGQKHVVVLFRLVSRYFVSGLRYQVKVSGTRHNKLLHEQQSFWTLVGPTSKYAVTDRLDSGCVGVLREHIFTNVRLGTICFSPASSKCSNRKSRNALAGTVFFPFLHFSAVSMIHTGVSIICFVCYRSFHEVFKSSLPFSEMLLEFTARVPPDY